MGRLFWDVVRVVADHHNAGTLKAKHVFLVVLSLIMTVKDIASSTNILPSSMMWVKRATEETHDFSLLPDAFEQNQNENVHLSSTVILLNHLLSRSNRL